MTPKEAKRMEKKLEPCRVCGGKRFLSGYTRDSHPAGLEHVIIRCKKCGDWSGGFTKKKKRGPTNEVR